MEHILIEVLPALCTRPIDQRVRATLHILKSMLCKETHQLTCYPIAARSKETHRAKTDLKTDLTELCECWAVTFTVDMTLRNPNDVRRLAYHVVLQEDLFRLPVV